MESIDNGLSKSEYSYDSCNQVTSETQTLTGQPARTVAYGYDADHLRLGMVQPSSRIVELAWTQRAQLAAVTADGPPPFATYTYDKAGRPKTLSHENGVVETKTYNAAGELLSNLHTLGGSTLSGHSYTYDTTSRRTAESFADGTTPARNYGYDLASQVTSATYGGGLADAYAYDPAGNRQTATLASQGGASLTYTANNVNQYTTITAQPTPVYDANGNLTQQNGNTYTWDSENRLLAVVPNTPATGAQALQYRYDAHHRRVTRTIQEWTGTAWASTATTHFIYDGWNVIEEYSLTSTTSTLAKTYTWGLDLSGSLQGAGGVGALLMAEEVGGSATTAYHFHYDGNGNVTEITNAAGASAASYRYDAFGNTLTAAGSYAATNRYRFSTKPLDAEVVNAPLYYYGYRYFDPMTGRWPSRDPIDEAGGLNLYKFASNSAVNLIDILGLNGQIAAIPAPSSPGGNLPSNVIRGPWAPRALPAAATTSSGAVGGVVLLGAVTVVAGVYTLFEIEEAIRSARRLRDLEEESSKRRVRCLYSRYGQPFGTPEVPLEHGGTCGNTCMYRCTDATMLLIERKSASECPFSNPKQVVDKIDLLRFSYGELPL